MTTQTTLRVGIAGLDHWYLGLAAVEQTARSARAEVTALAHRDADRAAQIAARYSIPEVTTDYRRIVENEHVDLVVTACPTAENSALVLAAARAGKHIISVKPFAMNMAEADTIVKTVRSSGVHFFGAESQYRLSPAYRQYKEWIDSGRFGKPVSAAVIVRTGVPTADFPGSSSATSWWLDAALVPGGGWIDHSIYHIDALRWLWGCEVSGVSGQKANLIRKDLPVEDYGIALLTFENGAIASVEVTWTAAPGASYNSFHLVGSQGQCIVDSISNRLSIGGPVEPFKGWITTAIPQSQPSLIEHMAAVILDGAEPAAGVEDAQKNLAVCLQFYHAAQNAGKAVR